MLVVLVLATLAAQPPVLLDPEGARQEARARAERPDATPLDRLAAAEALLLGQDPSGARALLGALPPFAEPALAARATALALDTAVALGDDAAVEALALTLAEHPGWQTHAARQFSTHQTTRSQRSRALFGSILFSLALAVMMIGGARELLRPRLPTVILAGVAALAVLGAMSVSPILGRVAMLANLGLLALAHAALSTVYRVAPAPRGRVFLAVLVLAGSGGVLLAILSPLPWAFVLGQLG